MATRKKLEGVDAKTLLEKETMDAAEVKALLETPALGDGAR